jgi:DNA-binding NarL/FixJ family response regulator
MLQHQARLMLIDDHEVVRRGIEGLIKNIPEWTICAESMADNDAIEIAANSKPDIVVMEVTGKNNAGFNIIKLIRENIPDADILVLTDRYNENDIEYALRCGVRGYVLKSDGGDNIVRALTALSSDKPYFSSAVSENMLALYLNVHADRELLTLRERQIVRLVAEGHTNKAIASILKVSVKTVETHRTAAMRKIGAKSTADVTLYAVRNELLQI